jgi:hypothetical protein
MNTTKPAMSSTAAVVIMASRDVRGP